MFIFQDLLTIISTEIAFSLPTKKSDRHFPDQIILKKPSTKFSANITDNQTKLKSHMKIKSRNFLVQAQCRNSIKEFLKTVINSAWQWQKQLMNNVPFLLELFID
jgi:hypothetical protein